MTKSSKNTGNIRKGVSSKSPLMNRVKQALKMKEMGPGCTEEDDQDQSPFERIFENGSQFPDPPFQPKNENLALFSSVAKATQLKKAKEWFRINQDQGELDRHALDFKAYDHAKRVKDRRDYHCTGGVTADEEGVSEMINFGLRTSLKVELPTTLTDLSLNEHDFEEYKDQNRSQSDNSPREQTLFRCAMALILLEQSPLDDCLCQQLAKTYDPRNLEFEEARRRSTLDGATARSLVQSKSARKGPENDGIWFSHRINHLIGGDCMAFPEEGQAVFGCYKRRCTQ